MTTNVGRLEASLTLDASRFQTAMQQVQTNVGAVQGKLAGLGTATGQVTAAGDRYVNTWHGVGGLNRSLIQGFGDMTRMMVLFQAGMIGMAAINLPMIIGGAAIKMSGEFEVAMRNVNSIAHLTDAEFRQMGAEAVALSTVFPQSAATIARGLYDIYSAGLTGARAMEALRASTLAASAGLTDVATANRVITAVMLAWGEGTYSAQQAADILFKTVEIGVFDFAQLAQAMGTAIPMAAALKRPLEEVGAALAVATQRGLDIDQATTSISRLYEAIVSPSKEARDLVAALGVEFGEEAVKAKGLAGVLEDVRAKTGMNIDALTTLFGDVRAGRLALVLMTDDLVGMRKAEQDIADSAGAAQRALNEQAKTGTYQFELFKNQVIAGAISMGNEVQPLIVGVFGALNQACTTLGTEGVANWLKFTSVAVASIALIAVPLGGLATTIAGVIALLGALGAAGTNLATGVAAGTMATKYSTEALERQRAQLEELRDTMPHTEEEYQAISLRIDSLTEALRRQQVGEAAAAEATSKAASEQEAAEGKVAAANAQTDAAQQAAWNRAKATLESLRAGTEKVKDAFKEAGISAQNMAQAVAASHPAVLALGLRVVGLKDQLAGVNAAIAANEAAQKVMQAAIAATQQRISALNEQLSAAKQHLSDLANPRLTGMGKIDDQIFDAEQAVKRLQLVAAGGVLPAGIKMPTGTLDEYQKLLERLRLQREVTYEPMLRQLQAAANPPAPEVGFGAAMADITATQATIASLTGQIASETVTLRDQQAALANLQAQQDMLRDSAAQLQLQIQAAEQQQRTMTDAIVAAIVWTIEESKKMHEFGGEVSAQATVVDVETQKMLKLFADFSKTHTDSTIDDINAVVGAWQAARDAIDRIAAGIAGGAGLPGAPAITVPGMQFGGIVTRPTLAMVGERGPEAIVPLSGNGTIGSTVVNVYVAGSVVAERDLAVAVRDELVRLQGRNRTTGIV